MEDFENESNISFLNKDISINGEDETELTSNEEDDILNNSLDFKNFSKSINLPIEKEIEYDNKINEIKKKKPNKELEIIPEDSLFKLEDNSNFIPPKISKLKPKKILDPVSPIKLCLKSFGKDYSINNKENEIVIDYSKDKNECQSCPDEDNYTEIEIEEVDFNSNNINNNKNNNNNKKIMYNNFSKININEFRKEMKNLKSCFEEEDLEKIKSKEYEEILNMDKIFNKKKYNRKLRRSIFKKHIQRQEEINFLFSSMGPMSILNNDIRKRTLSLTQNNNRTNTISINKFSRMKNSNISILGVLESAVNEKKRRNTVTVM